MKNRFLIGILMVLLIVTMFPVTQSSAESKNTSGQEIDKKEYQVSFRKVDSWEGHINGEITIKNIGDSMIKDWQLEMDFDGKIENIWNASVVSDDDHVVISNAGWNRNITPEETVSFGFIAVIKTEDVMIGNYELMSSTNRKIILEDESEEKGKINCMVQLKDNNSYRKLCDEYKEQLYERFVRIRAERKERYYERF